MMGNTVYTFKALTKLYSCFLLIILIFLQSARASDSGSETDPMSDSETVFHTVAVDMYNSVEPTVNRVVEPELIDVAVTSDPNSCDSAASSDILMPTQVHNNNNTTTLISHRSHFIMR